MKGLAQAMRFLTTLNYPYPDPYDEIRAKGLLRVSLGALVVLALYIVISPLFPGPNVTGRYGIVISVCIMLLAIMALVQRGQLTAGSLAFVVVAFVGALSAFAVVPSPRTLLAFTIPITAAGVLLNRRGLLVMTILVLLGVIVSLVLRQANLIALPIAPTPAADLTFTIAVLLIDFALLLTFAAGQRALQRNNTRLTQELRGSIEISQTLVGSQSLDDLCTQATKLIRDRLNYYFVRIFILEENSQLLVLQASTGGGAQRRIAPDSESLFNEVIRSSRRLVITANDRPERQREMLPAMTLQVLVPLQRDGKVLGVLDAQSITTDALTDPSLEALDAIAVQLAVSIENTRLFRDLSIAKLERQQYTEELTRARAELDEYKRQSLDRTLPRALGPKLEGTVGYDWTPNGIRANLQNRTSLQRVLENAVPELHREANEYVLSVPILLRGQVLGAMEFRAPLSRTWNSRSVELALVVAQRLALALDNIRLFEQAQEVANRERTASQIASRLLAKTNMDALMAEASASFKQALGATRANIYLGEVEHLPESSAPSLVAPASFGEPNKGGLA